MAGWQVLSRLSPGTYGGGERGLDCACALKQSTCRSEHGLNFMPRQLVEYRVFIGSPGGLVEERGLFREKIAKFNEIYGSPVGVVFAAIGWEDTLPGMGRP
jgi:hypothetical protein